MFPQRFLLFKADNPSIRHSVPKENTLHRRDHKGSLSWIKQSDNKPGRWLIVAPLTAGQECHDVSRTFAANLRSIVPA